MGSRGKILVTGAGGFIGGHIVEILHLTGSRDVVAGIRRWSSCARIGRFPVATIKVDLLSEAEVRRALEGVDCVIHCAQGSRGVIVQGTANLLEAALEKGIERIVHLSSIAVYGNASGEVSESFPYEYTGSEYGDAKIDAEKICFSFCKRGLPIVILRPSLVYGPYGTDWTLNILRKLAAGSLRGVGSKGEGRCNLLFVHDLFRAILRALTSRTAIGEAFNINGPEVITWNDYFSRFSRGLGLTASGASDSRGALLVSGVMEPVRMLGSYVKRNHLARVKTVAARFDLAKRWMKRTEQKLKATPSLGDLAFFSRDVVYATRKAEELLGFVPRFGADEGIRITNEWIRQQGFSFLGHGRPREHIS